MHRLLVLSSFFLMAFALAGCGASLNKPAPEIHRYAIAPAPPHVAQRVIGGALKVRRLTMAPGFAGLDMVYRTSDTRFAFDYYNKYLVSPADMLTQATRQALKEAQLFSIVTPDGSSLRPDYILEGTVVTMHGDFRDKSSPKAILEIQFYLLHDEEADLVLAHKGTYREEIPLADKGAQGLSLALEHALESVLSRLIRDLETL